MDPLTECHNSSRVEASTKFYKNLETLLYHSSEGKTYKDKSLQNLMTILTLRLFEESFVAKSPKLAVTSIRRKHCQPQTAGEQREKKR